MEEQQIEFVAGKNPDGVRGRFQGKKLLVTGASKGIGLATALLLAREGARVIRIARVKECLEKSRGLFLEGQCQDFSVDAADPDSVGTWVESYGVSEISGAAFCAGAHMMRPAFIAGNVTVGDDCLLGPNSSLLQRVKLGQEVIVGVGAIVLRDVPSKATVVPARSKVLRV